MQKVVHFEWALYESIASGTIKATDEFIIQMKHEN